MTATTFPPRRPGTPVPPGRTTTLPARRPSAREDDRRRVELARMEEAALEAGRWLRRTGRFSLPVRPRRGGGNSPPRLS
jgi:hypothetical protein